MSSTTAGSSRRVGPSSSRSSRRRATAGSGTRSRPRPSPIAMEPTATTAPSLPRSIEEIRGEFPILGREIHGRPLAYLDNGATAQKPLAVIETLDRYWRQGNANVHRGVHTISEEATSLYEAARETLAAHLGADRREV